MKTELWRQNYSANWDSKAAADDIAAIWTDYFSRPKGRSGIVYATGSPVAAIPDKEINDLFRRAWGMFNEVMVYDKGKYVLRRVSEEGRYLIGMVKQAHFGVCNTGDELEAAKIALKVNGRYETCSIAGVRGYFVRKSRAHRNLNPDARFVKIVEVFDDAAQAAEAFEAYTKKNQYAAWEQYMMRREIIHWALEDPVTGETVLEFTAADRTEALAVYLCFVKPKEWMDLVDADEKGQGNYPESAYERTVRICRALDSLDYTAEEKVQAIENLSIFAKVRKVDARLLKEAVDWLWSYHVFRLGHAGQEQYADTLTALLALKV